MISRNDFCEFTRHLFSTHLESMSFEEDNRNIFCVNFYEIKAENLPVLLSTKISIAKRFIERNLLLTIFYFYLFTFFTTKYYYLQKLYYKNVYIIYLFQFQRTWCSLCSSLPLRATKENWCHICLAGKSCTGAFNSIKIYIIRKITLTNPKSLPVGP